MTWDLHGYRIVTASAYPGMMAPLTGHPSCVCVLSGDADPSVAGMSLEGRDGVRRRWRFGDVAQLATFVPWVLADAPDDDRPVLLVPPRASAAWEAAAKGRVRLTASPRSVVELIAEDKIYVRDAMRRLGVPVPKSMVLHRSNMDFSTIAKRLGTPFVLQTPSGAGGQGTHLIQEPGDLALALANQSQERWLASRYAGDTTVNVAGVVHHDGVHVMPMSTQSSGLAELGFGFGGYCGSDFSHAPHHKVQAIGVAVGQWLRRRGHLGIYGVDVALDGDDATLLEVNPRIQGSSWLLSMLQQRQGDVPCLVQHVQALLGMPLGTTLRQSDPLKEHGSHLLVRWRGPSGVVRQRPEGETTAMPAIGTRLEPGAILARLEAPHSLTAKDGRSLLPATAAAVDRLLAGFTIDSARQPEMS
jgi:hypothetical protein